MTSHDTQVLLLVSALAVIAAASCEPGAQNCLANFEADEELQEVSLLQKDLQLNKKEKDETPSDSIVDREAQQHTSSSTLLADGDVVGNIPASWPPLSPFLSPNLVDASSAEAQLLAAAAATTTTLTAWHKPTDAGAASGVKTNGAGDLLTFASALATNIFIIGFCVVFFMFIKGYYPLIYSNNLTENKKLTEIAGGLFGWYEAALNVTSPEKFPDVIEDRGLDMALALKFMEMSRRIMLAIGLPMFLIMGPVNCLFGGNAAGEDHLSYFSFGNVENGSKLYWIHSFIVWGVVCTALHYIFAYHTDFMKLRRSWLYRLPKNRASTVMVEGIPEEYQSEAKLKEFFCDLFGEGKVQSTYLVKNCQELEDKVSEKRYKELELESAEKLEDHEKKEALETQLKDDLNELYSEIDMLRKKIKADTSITSEYRSSSGFVTFYSPADATLAQSVQISKDVDEWEVSLPPDPSSVRWRDLQHERSENAVKTVVGYLLVAGLYMAYMPCVIGITQIAVTIDMGPFQSMWAAFAPTMGLQFMVAFLPTFLVIIFSFCFTLKDEAQTQQRLQNWYFLFQLVFVILITAIGAHMYEFLDTLVEHPTKVFNLLGTTMPFATHFYMNYLVLQWTSHAIVLTRYIPLGKFLMARKIYGDEEIARSMAEPEDQDYYGIGSRSCRMSINLCIGLIYGTLSPPINILTWIEFYICSIVYGYLIPYAESKKPDLGGDFWVHQLKHIFVGLGIYCVVMTGVLLGRSDSNGPGVIALLCLGYVVWQYKRFNDHFSWEKPSYKAMKLATKAQDERGRAPDVGQYIQPFMLD